MTLEVWVAYKESSWLSTCFWVILLVCFGSISTCAYIVKQLFSISGQDSSQDPLQLVLLRKDGESKVNCSSVVLGRIVFSALGIIMSAIVVYTLVTDGWPFRMELLTPWMAATLIDFYINVFAISVWVFHKESTWIRAIFWVCLLICLGRVARCLYMLLNLQRRRISDDIYHLLAKSEPRTFQGGGERLSLAIRTGDRTFQSLKDKMNKEYSFNWDSVAKLFLQSVKAGLELPECKRPKESKHADDPNYCPYHRVLSHLIEDCYIFND
ncbi:hypothetical protein MA16_Dca012221 [Dendrobium catenatum]|uniref:Uncharacterized protein n=1 Tax=Dendrobium catenatum TaxID=906689 RepID=A0A2I0VQ09_9ASPA|nr:hypothetical protein MA16_Dca012221 [Dendrobium catenatum]